MSNKRKLQRKVNELSLMVDMYADLVDELENDLYSAIGGDTSADSFEAIAAEMMAGADQWNKMVEERDEYRKKLELAEEREKWNVAEKAAAVKATAELNKWYKAMEARYNAALSAQTRLERERGELADLAGRNKSLADYWELYADLCNTENMTAEEINEKSARLDKLQALAGLKNYDEVIDNLGGYNDVITGA